MSDKIKCPACGKEIKATSKHCGFCGIKIEEKTVKEESATAYDNPLENIISGGGRGRRAEPSSWEVVEETETPTSEVPESNVKKTVGKVCTSCGKKMSARAKYCGYCSGTLIDDPEGQGKEPPAFVPPKKTDNKETKAPDMHPDFKPITEL